MHIVSDKLPTIQAFHRALQISASLGTCIWDPIYQGILANTQMGFCVTVHGLDVQLPLRELTCRQVTYVMFIMIISITYFCVQINFCVKMNNPLNKAISKRAWTWCSPFWLADHSWPATKAWVQDDPDLQMPSSRHLLSPRPQQMQPKCLNCTGNHPWAEPLHAEMHAQITVS